MLRSERCGFGRCGALSSPVRKRRESILLRMVLAHSTWQEVRDFDRGAVCLVPTGSLEQHGPHLPLITDTLLSSHVAGKVEEARPDKTLLYPGVWLGCSSHHMAMAGTATASISTYMIVLTELIECALHHGFKKVFVLNGHGGNTEPNGAALRELKRKYRNHTFAHCGYFSLIPTTDQERILQGELKSIRHACEAEASMMMYVRPELVRREKLRDDVMGMTPPAPNGLVYIQPFDEVTEEGSWGYATRATAEKGRELLELAITGSIAALDHIHAGYYMTSLITTP